MYVELLEQKDPRCSRHIVHDPKSWDYRLGLSVDKSTWRRKKIRIIDPRPNPNQPCGCCTMCAKAMQFNAVGNRRKGVVLGMDWALRGYVWETHHDNFPGAWNLDGTGQDTGSSGLWAAKTAQHTGDGGVYNFLFGGADEVVQAINDGHAVSVGTRWDQQMFHPDSNGVVHPGGPVAGGHEWIARGHDPKTDLVDGLCWWGSFREFKIARTALDELLADKGDSHVQVRAQ